jgi:hypothetical protein
MNLVGFFFMNFTMVHGSTNVNFTKEIFISKSREREKIELNVTSDSSVF